MDRRQFLRIGGGVGAVSIGGYGLYEGTPIGSGWEPREGSLLSGVSPTSVTLKRLDDFESWLGRKHAVVGTFRNVGQPADTIATVVRNGFEQMWARGQIPHVAWQPYFPTPAETSSTVASEIAAGRYDDTLETWADELAAWAVRSDGPDRRLYCNFAPELTGDWVPWSPAVGEEDESDFVAMYRHVHETIMDTQLTPQHVQWLWTPDITNRGVDLDAAFPGDDYVDWVGIHGYNWANWGGWDAPDELYVSLIERIRSLTAAPIALTEFGCSAETVDEEFAPERKADWITAVYDLFERHDVRMAVWFNITTDADWPVFGGPHGTTRVEIDGQPYNVYPSYREAITDQAVLGPHPEHPRLLVDEEFTGDW